MAKEKYLFRITARELIEPYGTNGTRWSFHSGREEYTQAADEDAAWGNFLRRYHLLPRRHDAEFRRRFGIVQVEKKSLPRTEGQYIQPELDFLTSI